MTVTGVSKLPILTLPATPTGFNRSLTKEDWTLIENVEANIPFRVSAFSLELIEFFERREGLAIVGDEMKKRSKALKAHHGQKLAELLLLNQSQIPREWRQFYIAFPATIWQRQDDRRLLIPYLGWFEGQWVLYFGGLERGWNDRVRLIRIIK